MNAAIGVKFRLQPGNLDTPFYPNRKNIFPHIKLLNPISLTTFSKGDNL